MEDEDTPDEEALEPSSSTRTMVRDQAEALVVKEEADLDMDPALADWFKIDDKAPPHEADARYDEDSATDEDSDNADVAEDVEGEKEEDDLDDTVKKPAMQTGAFEASGSTVNFSHHTLCYFPHDWSV
jgi:DNA ligase-4